MLNKYQKLWCDNKLWFGLGTRITWLGLGENLHKHSWNTANTLLWPKEGALLFTCNQSICQSIIICIAPTNNSYFMTLYTLHFTIFFGEYIYRSNISSFASNWGYWWLKSTFLKGRNLEQNLDCAFSHTVSSSHDFNWGTSKSWDKHGQLLMCQNSKWTMVKSKNMSLFRSIFQICNMFQIFSDSCRFTAFSNLELSLWRNHDSHVTKSVNISTNYQETCDVLVHGTLLPVGQLLYILAESWW